MILGVLFMIMIKIIIAFFMSTFINALWIYIDYLEYKKLGYDRENNPFYIPWIFVFICWSLHVCFYFQVYGIF